MTNLEKLNEENRDMFLENLTDEQVQQVYFTPEVKEHGNKLWWDREKFDKLCNDPDLKNCMSKIFHKEAEEWVIHTFQTEYETVRRNLPIEQWTRYVNRHHPDLIPFTCWTLWLPYDNNYLENGGTNFSELTFEQKMWFMCFHKTIQFYGADRIDNISSDEIISKYNEIYQWAIEHAMKDFDKVMKTRQKNEESPLVLFGRFDVKWFLKTRYWITDSEYEKFEDYCELIYKHPEYVWMLPLPQKAMSTWGWLLLGMIIGALLTAWGYFAYQYFAWQFETVPTSPEQVWGWGRVELHDFQNVFKIVAAEAKYRTQDQDGEWTTIHYEEDVIRFKNHDGCWLVRKWKEFLERSINGLEWKKIDIKAKFNILYLFDAEWARCTVEKKPNWKWVLHITVNEPECEAMVEDAKITRSRGEIIPLKKFDNTELNALEDAKRLALEDAKKPDNLNKAKNHLREIFLNVFNTTWYNDGNISIKAWDFEDVVIDYIPNPVSTPTTTTTSPQRPTWNNSWWRHRQWRR